VTIVNTSATEPLVVLKHFNPGNAEIVGASLTLSTYMGDT